MTAARFTRALALVELMRPSKPLAAAMFVLLGAYLAAPPGQLWSGSILVAAAVVLLVTAFGLVINDCCDVAVDAIGKPHRPIPSGRVSSRLASAFAWMLAAAALALSTTLGLGFAVVAFAAVGLSWAYSYRLKGTLLLGNAAVALLVAAALVYGALTAGPVSAAAWMAAVIAFPYVLAQEALFNLEDEEQDRVAGLQTTATRLGAERAAELVRAFLMAFMVIALAPWVLGLASARYLAAVLVLLVFPTAVLIYLLRRPLSRVAVAQAAKLTRLAWVTSFLPLALLK
jgi:geranylgeranylglycerol-phosphate geranylgeranyltransferase